MKVIVTLAPGFEEIEALTTVDILRRADVDVRLTAVIPQGTAIPAPLLVTGAHGISVLCEDTLEKTRLDDVDAIILPGGLPGATHLADSPETLDAIRRLHAANKLVAAICAAPIAFQAAGIFAPESHFTCYPGFQVDIDASYTGRPVEISDNIITACGPGASHLFAFAILEKLGLAQKADALRKGMLYTTC